MNTKLETALITMLEEFTKMGTVLQETQTEIDALRQQVKSLDAQVKAQEVDNLPEWIDAPTAMKILNIADVDTLRGYAKQGLITQQRAANRKNYYPKTEVLSLPGRLVEMGMVETVEA